MENWEQAMEELRWSYGRAKRTAVEEQKRRVNEWGSYENGRTEQWKEEMMKEAKEEEKKMVPMKEEKERSIERRER